MKPGFFVYAVKAKPQRGEKMDKDNTEHNQDTSRIMNRWKTNLAELLNY